jgi:hypothetical protein
VLDGFGVRWTKQPRPGTGGLALRLVGIELQAIDLGAQVVGREVTIHVDLEAGIAVAEDALHGDRVRPSHHEQARGRVPEVVKSDRAKLRLGPDEKMIDITVPSPEGASSRRAA